MLRDLACFNCLLLVIVGSLNVVRVFLLFLSSVASLLCCYYFCRCFVAFSTGVAVTVIAVVTAHFSCRSIELG